MRRLKRDWRKVGGGGCGSCGSGAGYCGSEEAVRERERVAEAPWRVVWRGSTMEEGPVLGLRAWEAKRVERGGESRRKLRGPSSSGVWLRVLLGGGWVSGLFREGCFGEIGRVLEGCDGRRMTLTTWKLEGWWDDT